MHLLLTIYGPMLATILVMFLVFFLIDLGEAAKIKARVGSIETQLSRRVEQLEARLVMLETERK